VRTWTCPRRVPARSRVPANEGGKTVFTRERSDARSEILAQHYKVGRQPAYDVQAMQVRSGAVTCEPPSDFESPILKARSRFPGCGLLKFLR
jgi:hypothetical protein